MHKSEMNNEIIRLICKPPISDHRLGAILVAILRKNWKSI